MVERSSLPPFPPADNSLRSSGTHGNLKWASSAENKLHNSRDVFLASLVLWMSAQWKEMSIHTRTREAIGAEELGAEAGGVEWPFWHQLTAAVAQLPLASLSQSSLLSRVFDSHPAFHCLPDLTTPGHGFFYSIFPLLFHSFVARLSAWN